MNRIKSENGFMGHTHALSAIAIYLLVAALIPTFLFENILHTDNIFIFVSSIFIISGFALYPDFDNTQSTAISVLGIVGKGISALLRSIAVVIYHLIKTNKDEPDPNPHRGFWHTIPGGLSIFLIVLLTTMIDTIITLPIINREVTIGFLFAVFWIFSAFKMALAGLFGKLHNKIKRKGFKGEVAITIFALAFSVVVLLAAPSTLSYKWIAFVALFGYIIHILGDTLTKAGTPLLWPLKIKGKRWWTIRILGITAGGEIENFVFIPIFIVIILFSLFRIFSVLVGGM